MSRLPPDRPGPWWPEDLDDEPDAFWPGPAAPTAESSPAVGVVTIGLKYRGLPYERLAADAGYLEALHRYDYERWMPHADPGLYRFIKARVRRVAGRGALRPTKATCPDRPQHRPRLVRMQTAGSKPDGGPLWQVFFECETCYARLTKSDGQPQAVPHVDLRRQGRRLEDIPLREDPPPAHEPPTYYFDCCGGAPAPSLVRYRALHFGGDSGPQPAPPWQYGAQCARCGAWLPTRPDILPGYPGRGAVDPGVLDQIPVAYDHVTNPPAPVRDRIVAWWARTCEAAGAEIDGRAPRGCNACGRPRPLQAHHWAPHHLFGPAADDWPQGHLCAECHVTWHATVTPTMSGATGLDASWRWRGPDVGKVSARWTVIRARDGCELGAVEVAYGDGAWWQVTPAGGSPSARVPGRFDLRAAQRLLRDPAT